MKPSPILVYHKVNARFEFGITRVTPHQFERHIAGLIDAGYQPVTLSTLMNSPDRDDLVAITFDDAYESVYINAFPIMEKYGAKSTSFVITDFIGKINHWDVNLGWLRFRHMDAGQMREMLEAGHEFGSHTVTHENLLEMTDSEVDYELMVSKETLQDILGTEVKYVAFPFGRFARRVVELSEKAGYEAGCVFAPYNHKTLEEDNRIIYRNGVYLTDTVRSILSKIRPGMPYHWHRLKQNIINFANGGTIMVKSMTDKK
ncbi:MAG: Poly-beta-1,6-N-acetyl-D-glucosamine N-deacetylase [Candidatus Marinimicrobia bacterium]|nr:Poly-beta-1,6-N-acetyl-D-glucosamine N-deacetylase [Candidatus Neomarinimicrobiota bacterium]